MSESNEPSYYEVALTNRQVLVSFVILLGCVLASFVSGVYVGRQADPLPEGEMAEATTAAQPDEVAKLEEFKFFEDEEGKKADLDKPDLSSLREETKKDSTLAEDLGAKPKTTPPPPPPKAAPPKTVLPPPKTAPPPPEAAPPKVEPLASPADGGFIIQVFSSRDETQAKKVLDRLQSGGYQATLSPLDQGSLTMFRVRIGPFARRDLAEKVGADIHQKYKLETWITAAGN